MAQKKKAKRGAGTTSKRRRESAKAAAEEMGKARKAHDQLRMHLKKAHGHMKKLASAPDPFLDR